MPTPGNPDRAAGHLPNRTAPGVDLRDSQADATIVEKPGQETLDGLRDMLVAELRSEHVTDAFCKTVEHAGDRLATVLPNAEENPNELHNQLRVID